MKYNRAFVLNYLLPVLWVIILSIAINSFTLNKVRQQFETGNDLQNKNIEALIEAAQLSEQVTLVHLSVKNSLNSAIYGKISNEQIFRVHSNAVNSLNKITGRIQQLSRSIQIQEASPQDGQLLLDHFEKYKNFIIQTTDISSIDPKSASRFLDMAENHFNDFTEHAHHISALLAAHARSLNKEDRQLFESVFQRVTLIGLIGMAGILLLSVFTVHMTRKLIKA
jgi:hypothetical protein